jgi:ribosomal protein S18 acetylase RimI-like enzyme
MATSKARYTLRHPTESDLDAMVQFEIDIAFVSFAEEAVTDPEVHRKKLRKALERDHTGMFLAVDNETGKAVGWLWVAINTNFLTEDRYANFRSLAVAEGTDSEVAEALFARGIEYAREQGVVELTGKVNVNNVAMRMVYRKFGFEALHLTMRKRLPPR